MSPRSCNKDCCQYPTNNNLRISTYVGGGSDEDVLLELEDSGSDVSVASGGEEITDSDAASAAWRKTELDVVGSLSSEVADSSAPRISALAPDSEEEGAWVTEIEVSSGTEDEDGFRVDDDTAKLDNTEDNETGSELSGAISLAIAGGRAI